MNSASFNVCGSEGYRMAQELYCIAASQNQEAAKSHFDDVLAALEQAGSPLPAQKCQAIMLMFNALQNGASL